MASKYAAKTAKINNKKNTITKLPANFGSDYVRMWDTLRSIAECPTLCPDCEKRARETLDKKYNEDGKRI